MAYVRYTGNPSSGRYLLVLASLCFGLMAKPMIVTLPFVLLLVDVWPLRRSSRFWEKAPFFVLAVAASIVTFLVQQSSGGVRPVAAFPLGLRVENALVPT